MSKRQSENGDFGEKKKRKQLFLTILQKVELLKKLERGTSVKLLCNEYGIGSSTIYDLKKNKASILEFYAKSDSPKLMKDRKTLHNSKNKDLDEVLMEWIRQRRAEKIPLNRALIMEQAKVFHKHMELETGCDYSSGWFNKFKKRHGLKILSISGDKASADVESAEDFVEEFTALMSDEGYSPELVYNADETGLFWKYISRKTYVTPEENAPSGVKDCKERITVLGCSNVSGTHKCKLLIVGKSAKPRALKNVKILPVIYRHNKRAWMTQDIFTEWFDNHFITEAKAHCKKVGLPDDSKILLVLDNCTAHPSAEILEKDNVRVIFLPPNCTSLLQPLDQGILNSLKCIYKADFIRKCLGDCNAGTMEVFQKKFNIKDAVWSIASAWNGVKTETLANAWHRLWPPSIFIAGENETEDFDGFRISQETKLIQELLDYAKNSANEVGKLIDESVLDECLTVDKNLPVSLQLTDEEIIDVALGRREDEISDDEGTSDDEEKISNEHCIELTKQLIKGMEQKAFFKEQDILSVYKIQEILLKEQPKHLKQLKVTDMFKSANKN